MSDRASLTKGRPSRAATAAGRSPVDDENAKLRAALIKFVDHFGPLEDNRMLHPEARKCFRLAREALGAEDHARVIKKSLSQS